jgi:valyl-tRNA synthetase
LDIIEKSGADALRFGIAHLATETQDVRMPVEFECPHCHTLIEQTKQNRLLPRVKCPNKQCGKEFATQWASKPEDKALPRGLVVSERFELGRNFCNKLWNAARFALMNLEGYTPGEVADKDLAIEDRWILSRLATVTKQTTEALERYGFADAARALYDFAWDEFCSFYIEMAKYRLQNEATRPAAQRVLAHTLDVLLRLLHPLIPFLTEEVWQLLAQAAPQRGLPKPSKPAESVMIAPWPEVDLARQDATIESRFARFQEVLRGVREIRARQNIQPKTKIDFVVRCEAETAELLRPMEPYFGTLAGARARAMGPDVTPPAPAANFSLTGMEVFVDLADLIDVKAEIAKNEKEKQRLRGLIEAKEKKLANEGFVSRAPADVVQKERDALGDLHQQLQAVETFLGQLRGNSDKQRKRKPKKSDGGPEDNDSQT